MLDVCVIFFPLTNDFSPPLSQGNEHIRVSKFNKEGKEGKFITFLYEDTRTLYEGFRRGAKESSKSLNLRSTLILRGTGRVEAGPFAAVKNELERNPCASIDRRRGRN